jgi:hypothetical protein
MLLRAWEQGQVLQVWKEKLGQVFLCLLTNTEPPNTLVDWGTSLYPSGWQVHMKLVSSSSVMSTVWRLLEMAPNMCVWLRKLVFSPKHSWRVLWWLATGAANVCSCLNRCNEYDTTGAHYCFRLADHDDWSKWFAISRVPYMVAHWALLGMLLHIDC